MARPKNATAREIAKFEAAMAVDPPVIRWVLDRTRRVQVAVSIHDPHVDLLHNRNTNKPACVHGHAFDEENTIHRADGTRDCRKCKRIRDRASDERKRRAA
jgi:hypothetical protein